MNNKDPGYSGEFSDPKSFLESLQYHHSFNKDGTFATCLFTAFISGREIAKQSDPKMVSDVLLGRLKVALEIALGEVNSKLGIPND